MLRGRKINYRALCAVCACAFFVSCATDPARYALIDKHIERGGYIEGVSEIEAGQERRPARYPPKNAVLLYLDKGLLEHYAGSYADSSADLERAERLIEDAYTKSVTLEIGTYILNDNTREYAGEDYEDLYLNIFNALNYYQQGGMEDALVEVRKINLKLRDLEIKYAGDIERAKEYAKQHGGWQGGGNAEPFQFFDSALARYLAGLFWRGNGRADDARIDFDAMDEVYTLSPRVYPFPKPEALPDEYQIPKGLARLNVLVFTGLSPVKIEENVYIPLPFDWPLNHARIALPVLRDRSSKVSHIEVTVGKADESGGEPPASGGKKRAFSGESLVLELIEDLGLVMAETFKAKQTTTYVKTVVRTIVKASASAAAQEITRQKTEDSGWGLLAGLAGSVLTNISESADTRSVRYIPRYAFGGGINLAPGVYALRIQFYAAGHVVETVETEISLTEGKLNLFEAVCLK